MGNMYRFYDIAHFLVFQISWQPKPSVTNTGPWGLGACLGSAALAKVVFFVSSHAVFLSSFFRFDVLV
jgi:hypothetical protein